MLYCVKQELYSFYGGLETTLFILGYKRVFPPQRKFKWENIKNDQKKRFFLAIS